MSALDRPNLHSRNAAQHVGQQPRLHSKNVLAREERAHSARSPLLEAHELRRQTIRFSHFDRVERQRNWRERDLHEECFAGANIHSDSNGGVPEHPHVERLRASRYAAKAKTSFTRGDGVEERT